MEHFVLVYYTLVHKIFLIFYSNSSWFTNIEYRIPLLRTPLIKWNNLIPILIIFVAEIDANKKFLSPTLDFDDFIFTSLKPGAKK